MRYTPIFLLLLVITACTPSTSEPSPDVVSTGMTTVPVIASLTETQEADVEIVSTQTPIMTAQEPSRCDGAPEIRLIIQERGRVTDTNDDTLNLRNGPGTSFDILIALNPRDVFTVIDGPTCAGGFAWFRVRYRNTVGWLAEGDAEDYYVEPYLTG